MPIFKWVDPKTGTPNYSDRDLAPQAAPAAPTPKSTVANPPTAQPGDPGFNWDTYGSWKAGQPDVVGDAKKTLAHANTMSASLGLDTPSYPNAAKVRAAHPGAYDDLTDQQLDLALGKQKATETTSPGAMTGRIASGVMGNDPLTENPITLGEVMDDPMAALHRFISPEHAGGVIRDVGIGALTNKAPAILHGTGSAMKSAGGLVERGGQAAMDFKGGGIPALGALEAVMHSGPTGAAIAAAPYAVRSGGRGMQSMGGAMQGLASVLGHEAPGAPSMTPVQGRQMYESQYAPSTSNPSSRQPYTRPDAPSTPWQPNLAPEPAAPPTPFQQMQQQGEFLSPRLNSGFDEAAGGLTDVNAGRVKPESYISDITAGTPDIPGLSVGKLEKSIPMSQVPFSKARQTQRQSAAFQKFTGEGDLTPDEMSGKVGALNESSPWPPKPGQEGFGMQRTPARGSFTSQDSLIQLINAKYPHIKVKSLKDFPMPGGSDPLSKAIRQRGHAFGGK